MTASRKSFFSRFTGTRSEHAISKITSDEAKTETARDYEVSQITGPGRRVSADENFDELVQKKGITIYDKMMTDAVVSMAINQKRFDVISADWEIVPASSSELDKQIADHTRYSFERMEGSVVGAVFGIMSYLIHGYSIGEMNFEVVQNGDYAGKWFISSIRNKNLEDFYFEFDDFGNIKELWCRNPKGPDEKVPIHKFVIATYQPEYGRVFGRSDLRPAYKHYWTKNNLMKMQNIYLERYAIPSVRGKYPPGQEGRRANFLKMLSTLSTGSAIAHSSDLEVDFIAAGKSAAGEFDAAIKYHDDQIVKAILGQTLTSGEGQRVGSLALGNVHKETKEDYVSYLRNDLAELIREKIIKPFVDLNYPSVSEYPSFAWQPRKGKLTIANIPELTDLLKSGIVFGADVNTIRERIDLPWSKHFDNDEIYEPPAWALGGVAPGAFVRDESTGESPVHIHQHSAPALKSEYVKPAKPRAMTASEKRIGGMSYYAAQIKKLDKSEDGFLDDLAPIMKKIQQNMQKYISEKILSDPKKNRAAINDLKIPAGLLREINDAAKTYIVNLTNEGYLDAIGEVKSGVNPKGALKPGEYGRLDLTLEAAPDAGAVAQINKWRESGDWKSIRAWRAAHLADLGGTHETMARFWITDVIEDGLLRNVKNNIVAGLMNTGANEASIMATVRDTFEKWGANPKLTDPARLRAIVRTNTTRAIMDSRRLAFTDPEVVDEFPAMMFSAIMDDSVCGECAALDESIYRSDDPIWNIIGQPIHINCRCTVIAVSTNELKEAGESKAPDLENIPEELGGLKRA